MLIISDANLKAKSNQLVKETKLKEKLEEQLKANNYEMEKMKSDLNSVKSILKKTENDLEKNNDTLKQFKVIFLFVYFIKVSSVTGNVIEVELFYFQIVTTNRIIICLNKCCTYFVIAKYIDHSNVCLCVWR